MTRENIPNDVGNFLHQTIPANVISPVLSDDIETSLYCGSPNVEDLKEPF